MKRKTLEGKAEQHADRVASTAPLKHYYQVRMAYLAGAKDDARKGGRPAMKSKTLVGFIAHCKDCDWTTEDYMNGQRQASRHAAKWGHEVSGEATYAVEYGAAQRDARKGGRK